MLRKTLLVVLVVCCIVLLFLFSPWESKPEKEPLIIDRLPVASIIGQTNVLNLSGKLSKTAYFYDLSFRDVLSPNILLSQGKKYGIHFQEPVYFFANDSLTELSTWGLMASVMDSSKILPGITILNKEVNLFTFNIDGQRVYFAKDLGIYCSYGKDWILFYKGPEINSIVKQITSSRLHHVHPRWRLFLNKISTSKIDLIAEIQSEQLEKFGIESSIISLSNDSTDIVFNAEVVHRDSLIFQLKSPGYAFHHQEFSKQLINLHFDLERINSFQVNPYWKQLELLSNKISFPLTDFLTSWTGDIAFRRGGILYINEQFITSELDDDFNVTEVEKTKRVKITGFSMYLSMNNKGPDFKTKLLEKGILSTNKNHFRLLHSPPLNFKETDTSFTFYTGQYIPEVNLQPSNEVMWTFNYTPVYFSIDSTATKSIFGRIRVPLKKIIEDNFSLSE